MLCLSLRAPALARSARVAAAKQQGSLFHGRSPLSFVPVLAMSTQLMSAPEKRKLLLDVVEASVVSTGLRILEPTLRGKTDPNDFVAMVKFGLGENTYDRQPAIDRAIEYIQNPPEAIRPQKFDILATWGGPGSGKTHLLVDLLRADVKKHFEEKPVETGYFEKYPAFREYLPLFVTFNSQMDHYLDIHAMSVRILCTYFIGFDDLTGGLFSAVAPVLASKLPVDLQSKHVLDAVEYDFAENHDVSVEQVRTVLLVDEIRKAGGKEQIKKVHNDTTQALYTGDNFYTRRGLVMTSLDQTTLLTDGNLDFNDPSLTRYSERRVWLLSIPLIDVNAWLDDTGVTDTYHRRLYNLTGGHPRSIELVKKTLSRFGSSFTKDLNVELRAIRGRKPPAEYYYSAFTNVKLQLKQSTTTSGRTVEGDVRSGDLINALSEIGATSVKHVVPRISLYDVYYLADNAVEYLDRLLFKMVKMLLILPDDDVSPTWFEKFHVWHTALLLQVHCMAREFLTKMILPDPLPGTLQLFGGGKDMSTRSLFHWVNYVHIPTGSNVKNLQVVLDADCRGVTINESMWANKWTPVEDSEQWLFKLRSVNRLKSGDQITTAMQNQEGIDTALFVKCSGKCAEENNHLVLFECKTGSQFDAMHKIKRVQQKVQTLIDSQEHPLYLQGIKKPQQVTFCLVSPMKKLRSKTELEVENLALDQEIEFNIIWIDRDNLVNHYGPSFKPAMAIWEDSL